MSNLSTEGAVINASRPRITSQNLKAMRAQSQNQHVIARFFTGFWSAISSALSLSVAPKRNKATFCELNGHLLKANLDPHCRYCGKEIDSVDMLRSIK